MESKDKAIIRSYAQLAKKLKRYPARVDLLEKGISRDQVRSAFGNYDKLKAKAREQYPRSFDDIIDEARFNDEAYSALKKEIKKHKRFFITTAVAGHPVNDDFLASIKAYCKIKKAMLLILPAKKELANLDPVLVDEHIVFEDLTLNSNLHIDTIQIDPKQVDPITGLDRFGAREGSFIFASPKQRLRPVAIGNEKLSHLLMTTGAITEARYCGKGGRRLRRDTIAAKDHVMGGLIVEVKDDNVYFSRMVRADSQGRFIDLGVRYSEDGAEKIKTVAVVYGDYHSGETDPEADKAGEQICKLLQPDYLVLHDFFNGKSISHHEKHKKILQGMKALKNEISLATELFTNLRDLTKLVKLPKKKIIRVKSNHDTFLERHLEDGEYDDQNRLLCMRLALHMAEGKDPYREALKEMGFKHDDKIQWLKLDEDFRVTRAQIQLGAHGDIGANGKRNPGAAGMEKSYGACIYGHCHYPEVLREVMSVGTKSLLKVGYNVGPSSWLHTDAAVYEDGSRQLLMIIAGEWCLQD